jgi:activator of HSP90 ATPase
MEVKTKKIEQKVFIPATPMEVYDAFMDPVKHAEFTGDPASGSSEVGGEFIASNGYITAKNLELEKGKKIVQEWSTSEWPEGYPPSRLEITLKKAEGGTDLTMVQTMVPEEQADSYEYGWYDFYWEPVVKYFQKKAKRKERKRD